MGAGAMLARLVLLTFRLNCFADLALLTGERFMVAPGEVGVTWNSYIK